MSNRDHTILYVTDHEQIAFMNFICMYCIAMHFICFKYVTISFSKSARHVWLYIGIILNRLEKSKIHTPNLKQMWLVATRCEISCI